MFGQLAMPKGKEKGGKVKEGLFRLANRRLVKMWVLLNIFDSLTDTTAKVGTIPSPPPHTRSTYNWMTVKVSPPTSFFVAQLGNYRPARIPVAPLHSWTMRRN